MTEAQLIASRLLSHIILKEHDSSLVAELSLPEELKLSYLRWMCHEVIDNPRWDSGKAHRWIGYVQGVLVCRGLSTVDDERTRVREVKAPVSPLQVVQ